MNWATRNNYGECAVDDLMGVAERVQKFVERRGCYLNRTVAELHRSIVNYIGVRRKAAVCNVHYSPRRCTAPVGWTAHMEEVWQEWLSYYFSLDDWYAEVMYPIFGSDMRTWEASCPSWRMEIFVYLDDWMQRSTEIVAAFDMTPLKEVVEDEHGDIDPYLIENGLVKDKVNQGKIRR